MEEVHAAGGKCQCTGECGHTHAWNADVKPQRCRAPHGCTIVRKLDYPSYWQLAGTDVLPLEFPEHYAVDKPIMVELKALKLKDGETTIAVCQRCKLLIEEAQGTGKKRRRKAPDG